MSVASATGLRGIRFVCPPSETGSGVSGSGARPKNWNAFHTERKWHRNNDGTAKTNESEIFWS